MPIYLYLNEKTKEVVEIQQSMKEEHKYSKDGIEYKRVYVNPNLAVNGNIIPARDPFDVNQFKEKTRGRGTTISELWEESAELSEKRAKIAGQDPIKTKFLDNYRKRTKKEHPQIQKEKATKELKDLGVTVTEPKKWTSRGQ